jgi:N-acetylated-alpha-linked acidic dipeptidase
MSYEDAIPILRELQGKGEKASDISEDWVGGLGHNGIEYWTGPSEVELHMINEVNTVRRDDRKVVDGISLTW